MSAPDAKRLRVEGQAASVMASAARRGKPHERLLGDWGCAPASLAPAWLVKSALALPAGHPSPGAVQGSRLVLRAPCEGELAVYAASGARVFLHTLAWPAAAAVQRGKEGILRASPVPGGSTQPLSHLPFRAEVQSLDALALPGAGGARQLLAAADAYGCVTLACDAAPLARGPAGAVASLQPPQPSCEPGWAGVALGGGGLVACARGPARALDLYDGELHAATRHLAHAPAAIALLPAGCGSGGGGALAALAEGGCVAVWDARAGGAVPALRLAAAAGAAAGAQLLALAAAVGPSGAPLLAAAGEERSLCVFDLRSAGRLLRRHPGAARKEVTHLRFSAADARWLYAASGDNEVLCRRWDAAAGDAAARGPGAWAFRGEARWAGLALQGGEAGDTLAAYTANGSLVCALVGRGGEGAE